VLAFLAREGLLDNGLRVRPIFLKDEFTDQAKPEVMYHNSSLDSEGIVRTVFEALGKAGVEKLFRA
jgi:1-deoxy-D-xylulose-5-phosphate synthase